MTFSGIAPEVLSTVGAIFAALVAGSIAVRVVSRKRAPEKTRELKERTKTWWFLCAIFFGAVLTSKAAATCLFAFVSFLAFKEYVSLIPTRRADRRVLFWCYLAIPFQYYWAYSQWYGMFIIFIPVYLFLLLPFRMITIGQTDGFLRAAGTLHWGAMTTIFSVSHIAYLGLLDDTKTPCGSVGMLIFLVVCTQLNDIAQYVWGKSFGKRKVVPSVSPNKTWAGLIGGVGTTTALALLLGPVLTPLNRQEALGAGLIIGIGGFVGDVVISAFKRDLGIKDSGSMLPGHGGILDRIDSLTYAAPLFFHYVYYLHF